MQCEQCQQFILTDYLDGETNDTQNREIEEHLSCCTQCKEFAQNAKKITVEPFENMERLQPSPQVWANIQEKINQPQEQPDVLAGFLDKVKELLSAPRSAFALATALAVILMIVTLVPNKGNQSNVARIDPVEQIEYMASLEIYEPDENGYYETDIEEYFL